MKQIILLSSIIVLGIVSYASNIKESSCENGDAIACYELGKKIDTNPFICNLEASSPLTDLLNSVDGVKVTKQDLQDAEKETKRLEKLCPEWQPDKVKYMYTKACQFGYAYGCREINKKFDKKKVALLQGKCKNKDAESCSELGLIYYTRSLGGFLTSVVNDDLLEKAEDYYTKSCTCGSGEGCYFLASTIGEQGYYRREKNMAIDMIDSYKKACELGYGIACSKMGEVYGGNFKYADIDVNETKANDYRSKACDKGSLKDCSTLAFSFSKDDASVLGFSDDLTDPIARKYRVKACELGGASSCDKMAKIYDNGLGVKQDYFKAVSYYKKACESDMEISCTNLGIKYYNGQGARQDYAKAKHYFKDACFKGELNACNNLGLMYSNGTGTKQDYFRAKNFFEEACNPPPKPPFNTSSPLGAACINLGIAYLKGLGVKQSLQKAREYFGKACDNGLQSGCSEYAKLNRLGK